MQLIPCLCVLWAFILAGNHPALAQSRASTRVDVYTDDWITVVAPAGVATIQLDDAWSVEAGYTIDVLSGATQVVTTDMVTSATHFSETRHEGHLSMKTQLEPTWWLRGRYGVSVEPDYVTHTAGVAWSGEALERRATLSAGYNLSLERVGMSTDPTFAERASGHTLDLSWTHVVSRRSSLAAMVTGQLHACGPVLGCQANPYRYVAMISGDSPAMTVREHHPQLRARAAAALRFKHRLGKGFALHAGYRFYRDSWQVTGNTGDLSLARGLFGERLVLRADVRFTGQTAAAFYQDTYTLADGELAVPAYRTGDRELSGLHDLLAGVRLEASFPAVGPFLRLGTTARAARIWYRYPDFSELPARDAWVIGGGAYAEF